MTAPLLSVVTVVRDDLPGLLATHASLCAQGWRGFEWLVVDGGSRDGTADWLAARADEPAWWRSAPDGGPYDGMNAGLERARGRWLLFLNAGDTLAGPDTLARLAAALTACPDADFLYGDSLERGTDGRWMRKPARSHRLAFYGMFTHHQAMVYRRSLLEGLRYQPRYAIGADYAFTVGVLARASRVVRLPFAVCAFAGGGLSQRRPADGRADQTTIRREVMGLGPAACAGIVIAQCASLALRRTMAPLYEKLRYTGAGISLRF
ncbi:glycosyltransferase [Azospirillum halopraeferens]|uniref:glycosyltransferase n=1 Tax=Azospirillum halopraeferens TaxID=34010 RepID=UPI000400E363|nr:glycosyltransferase [Azospirillum halopraeferens]